MKKQTKKFREFSLAQKERKRAKNVMKAMDMSKKQIIPQLIMALMLKPWTSKALHSETNRNGKVLKNQHQHQKMKKNHRSCINLCTRSNFLSERLKINLNKLMRLCWRKNQLLNPTTCRWAQLLEALISKHNKQTRSSQRINQMKNNLWVRLRT